MACTIQEVLKSKRNAGNTASIIIARLLCDAVSDLPSQTGLTGYELAQGCTAHVISNNKDYMIDSSGNWHAYGSSDGGGDTIWGNWLSGDSNVYDEIEALDEGTYAGYAVFGSNSGVPSAIEGLCLAYRVVRWNFSGGTLAYFELLRGNGDRYFTGKLLNGWYSMRADYYSDHSLL